MSYRILMIDDDREMMTLGRLILEREGFQVVSAFSGGEGLELLHQDDTIDLVLLDIMMIGMDGWQVLEAHLEGFTHALDPQLWPELNL